MEKIRTENMVDYYVTNLNGQTFEFRINNETGDMEVIPDEVKRVFGGMDKYETFLNTTEEGLIFMIECMLLFDME